MSALSYEGHYLVDKKHRVVVAATASDTIENADKQTSPLLLQTKFRHGLRFQSFCADSEYGTQGLLHFLFSEGITPFVPPPHPNTKPNPFAREAFTYDRSRNVYICPNGNELVQGYYDPKKKRHDFRHAISGSCKTCCWKALCAPGKRDKGIQRLLYQDDVDRARELREMPDYRRQMSKRIAFNGVSLW